MEKLEILPRDNHYETSLYYAHINTHGGKGFVCFDQTGIIPHIPSGTVLLSHHNTTWIPFHVSLLKIYVIHFNGCWNSIEWMGCNLFIQSILSES